MTWINSIPQVNRPGCPEWPCHLVVSCFGIVPVWDSAQRSASAGGGARHDKSGDRRPRPLGTNSGGRGTGQKRPAALSIAVTRDPDRTRDFLDQHGLRPVSTLDAVLADPGIDAVVLATPHSTHTDQIIAVAASGKAVFCEKPLTLTRAEAERAVAACRAAGIVLGVGTDKRFFPAMQELARIAASGNSAGCSISRPISVTRWRPRCFRRGAMRRTNCRPAG